MVHATLAYLAEHEAIWESNPAFVKAVSDLKKAVAAIDAANDNSSRSGSSRPSRVHTREMLEDLTSAIADQLFALSEETGDLGLAAASDFSRASLYRLTDEELEHTAKHVCELASAHLDALANYLVVAADVAQLATLTSNFSMTKVRTPLPAFRRTLTASTAEERLRAANRILRARLDKLVSRYKPQHPDFVSNYIHARIVDFSPDTPAAPRTKRRIAVRRFSAVKSAKGPRRVRR
ncbi:hypothetical protein Oter_3484 [Opitutus terrae PB90-1]|uniref:Uncharacterized protein n=2 Tax=Opitutus terrae TaxID=107709 RepID=B1ZV94_OPITP|nr:hypothetical protein Oter_3484 [Opitutus terrae PB90-1]